MNHTHHLDDELVSTLFLHEPNCNVILHYYSDLISGQHIFVSFNLLHLLGQEKPHFQVYLASQKLLSFYLTHHIGTNHNLL